MNARDRRPRSYQPPTVWRTCTNPACAVMWSGIRDVPCWACGAAGHHSRSPSLNSQHGFAPPSTND